MTDEELKKAKAELRRKPYMTKYGMWKIRIGKERIFAENMETHKFTPSFSFKELDKMLVFLDGLEKERNETFSKTEALEKENAELKAQIEKMKEELNAIKRINPVV